MSDFGKLFLVWIGVPVIGVLISCILGWIATKIHKNVEKYISEPKGENK